MNNVVARALLPFARSNLLAVLAIASPPKYKSGGSQRHDSFVSFALNSGIFSLCFTRNDTPHWRTVQV
jgi:hypothetical protein